MGDTRIQADTLAARKLAFLTRYSRDANVAASCGAAGVCRGTSVRWRKEDPDFGRACSEAYEAVVDVAEAEVRRRGVDGWQEPVMVKGAPVFRRCPITGDLLLDELGEPVPLTVNRRSDRLLEVYVKANRAGYRDRRETTVKVEGGIEVRRVLDLGSVPTEQLEALGALLALPPPVDAEFEEVPTGDDDWLR